MNRKLIAIAEKNHKTAKLYKQTFGKKAEYTLEHSDLSDGEAVLKIKDNHGFGFYCLGLVKNGWTVDAMNKEIAKDIETCRQIANYRRRVIWKDF